MRISLHVATLVLPDTPLQIVRMTGIIAAIATAQEICPKGHRLLPPSMHLGPWCME